MRNIYEGGGPQARKEEKSAHDAQQKVLDDVEIELGDEKAYEVLIAKLVNDWPLSKEEAKAVEKIRKQYGESTH